MNPHRIARAKNLSRAYCNGMTAAPHPIQADWQPRLPIAEPHRAGQGGDPGLFVALRRATQAIKLLQ